MVQCNSKNKSEWKESQTIKIMFPSSANMSYRKMNIYRRFLYIKNTIEADRYPTCVVIVLYTAIVCSTITSPSCSLSDPE